MTKYEANTESKHEVITDLGDATKNTLGTTRAGVHEVLGPRRYRR